MIKIEKHEVVGWEHAIRGMRNPMNSWDKMDSDWLHSCLNDKDKCPKGKYQIGENDHDLMMRLANGGPVHAKYRRMIGVYVDITAPLYWWKEFDTYKVGTVANSCSTMHKIHAKGFTLEDFSCEYLDNGDLYDEFNVERFCETRGYLNSPLDDLEYDIEKLNMYRTLYLKTNDKRWWWQMIQRLPSNYNQKRTVLMNYEVLANIYESRNNHKLDEWREFCMWIEELPYSEIITDPYWNKVNERTIKDNRIKELEDSLKELTAKNEQLRLKLLEYVGEH